MFYRTPKGCASLNDGHRVDGRNGGAHGQVQGPCHGHGHAMVMVTVMAMTTAMVMITSVLFVEEPHHNSYKTPASYINDRDHDMAIAMTMTMTTASTWTVAMPVTMHMPKHVTMTPTVMSIIRDLCR